jgi:hypothetical protein
MAPSSTSLLYVTLSIYSISIYLYFFSNLRSYSLTSYTIFIYNEVLFFAKGGIFCFFPAVRDKYLNNREGLTEKEISNKRTAISERRKESRHVPVSRSLCTVRRVFAVCRHVGAFWWMVCVLKLIWLQYRHHPPLQLCTTPHNPTAALYHKLSLA